MCIRLIGDAFMDVLSIHVLMQSHEERRIGGKEMRGGEGRAIRT